MFGHGETQGSSADQTARRRVLVIDDEPMMGMTLRVALSEENQVVVVESGHRARELLEEDRRFDAILCDLMMPDYSGMELHSWLRQNEPPLAERMVFMTGGAYTERARHFLGQVPNPRVQKPFDLDELLGIVRTLGTSDVECAPHP